MRNTTWGKFTAIALLILTIGTGCSAVDNLLGRNNALILYGTEQKINEAVSTIPAKSIKENVSYEGKINGNDENRTLFITKATAEALVKQGAIKQVEVSKNSRLHALPEQTLPLLFARSEKTSVKTGDSKLKVTYGGNIVIGEGRSYIDEIVVMNQADWEQEHAQTSKFNVVHVNKDPDTLLPQLIKIVNGVQMFRIEK
ncbi:lipoprotein BA_5634 family protein [Paenibacillus sp. 481]|uniref:lipoprotein BA_5634 family protein n=1 Tax=Paenibacillus sp. 481 TaxID=2835869 RepID=UPI001E31C9C3|nr:lipoprotein BA_5634 family protein [Paenibacillus sp. 481]UHA71951.1 hypothetical protein KIK04_14565 [Paenibacillus sp. 481]